MNISTLKILLLTITLASSFTSFAAPVAAPVNSEFPQTINMRFCIFDIVGTKGDAYTYAKDLALEAKKWNIQVELKVYTDERIAAEDFKAGQYQILGRARKLSHTRCGNDPIWRQHGLRGNQRWRAHDHP